MRVLGVDPGYDRLGVAVLERQHGKEVVLYSACLTSDRTAEHADRLHALGSELAILLQKYEPNAVAVETLYFNQNTTTAIGVAEARGMVLYLAKDISAKVCEYSPQAIKVATTGYGKSDKAAVIQMVKQLVPTAPKNGLDDEYDAIAVGITCLAHHQ